MVDLDAIAKKAWEENRSVLERIWEGMGWQEPGRPPQRWRLHLKGGGVAICQHCGRDDGWVVQGDPERPQYVHFICADPLTHRVIPVMRGCIVEKGVVMARDVDWVEPVGEE